MTHNYAIKGMHCQSCVQKLTDALRNVAGIESVEVTLRPPRARVVMREHISTPTLDTAVKSAGSYEISDEVMPPAEPTVASAHAQPEEAAAAESLYPLFLIVGYILGAVLLVAFATDQWTAHSLMNHFMAGFFLVFSFFKFLNLRGFADAYASYDIVARRFPVWGLIYPFVELGLGIAYLLNVAPWTTNSLTLVVMLVSSIGVIRTLLDKRKIRCACLGTVLNLPMTKVTLVEDLGMAAMAAGMLGILLMGGQ